jgi:hypothetical protein
MNDPNGMFVDADGLFHLYYQCTFLEHHQKLLQRTDDLQITLLLSSPATNIGATRPLKTCTPGKTKPLRSFPADPPKAYSLAAPS